MSETRPVVAMIGLGRMGTAMARRFHDTGHRLVVWNRSPEKSQALAEEIEVEVAPTPAAAAAGVATIVSSLADDQALRAVYLGPDGIADGIAPGAIALDTSTVDPESIDEVGGVIDAKGAIFLDCPVSGSVSTVDAGNLVIMGGGDSSALDICRPLLETIAKKVLHVGPRGAGAACKLAVNGLVHGLNVALSEAFVLAERANVDPEKAYDVFSSGAAGAPFVGYKREAFLHPETTPVAFTLDLMGKDLELITTLGRRVGVPMAQAETGLQIVNDAIREGMGQQDMSSLASYLRAEADV